MPRWIGVFLSACLLALGSVIAAERPPEKAPPPTESDPAKLIPRLASDSAAERDDALALGALRKGRLAGLLVLRFPAWDREHFGFTVARVEHLQGSDASALWMARVPALVGTTCVSVIRSWSSVKA